MRKFNIFVSWNIGHVQETGHSVWNPVYTGSGTGCARNQFRVQTGRVQGLAGLHSGIHSGPIRYTVRCKPESIPGGQVFLHNGQILVDKYISPPLLLQEVSQPVPNTKKAKLSLLHCCWLQKLQDLSSPPLKLKSLWWKPRGGLDLWFHRAKSDSPLSSSSCLLLLGFVETLGG